VSYIRSHLEYGVYEAACGAGKSHIIAEIAKTIYEISNGKSVLCLAPTGKLVKQNREKYLKTGNPASMYSASAGRKCLKHPVVFGTPLTVKGAVDKIAKNIAAVIIDEADAITPTVKYIISELKKLNPNLRVIGLTATPYRTGEGFIYQIDENGNPVDEVKSPYFKYLIGKIGNKELTDLGYLTPYIIGDHDTESYDTGGLVLQKNNKYLPSDIDRAFVGKGRLTSNIIADIVDRSKNRMAVAIFASTKAHVYECMESLPLELTACILDDTSTKERDKIFEKVARGEIKYLVSVSCVAVGVDLPRLDVIALLRLTESARLLNQIAGRGTRIYDENIGQLQTSDARKKAIANSDKPNFMILDYAGNIEKHAPDGDIFNPEITAPRKSDKGGKIKALCPSCGYDNVFSVHMDRLEYDFDENGYALDLEGLPVKTDNGDPLPVHHGRRCEGVIHTTGDRCGYRWTHKKCEECGEENDIAARNCRSCNAEIVDPNTKLKEEFVRKKTNPYEVSTDKVLEWHVQNTVSNGGNPMYKVTFKTEYALPVAYFLYEKNFDNWRKIKAATNNMQEMPKTITYYKKQGSKFWEILDYNRAVDEDPR